MIPNRNGLPVSIFRFVADTSPDSSSTHTTSRVLQRPEIRFMHNNLSVSKGHLRGFKDESFLYNQAPLRDRGDNTWEDHTNALTAAARGPSGKDIVNWPMAR